MDSSSINGRMLAPVALGAAFLALIVAVIASGIFGDGADYKAPASKTDKTVASKTKTATTAPVEKPVTKPAIPPTEAAVYTLKDGDDLATVAEKSGVTVAKLIELNPDADPLTLAPGQKLNLR